MDSLVSLAQKAIEGFVENGKTIPVPNDFPKEFLEKKAGVFVTIEKKGELRGCIGTYVATRENIAEEVIRNAIASATQDDRFAKIAKEEVSHLSFTIYVLNPPEQVTSTQQLDPKKFGAIVMTTEKCGLLLPDLEGVETVEQQLNICCQKGGIDPLKEKIAIFKFEVQKYGEPESR
ncbi:MAG: AmmeMemoRadiSam system protein A [bacterium]|nr:AmmeMemoRadiSam system protein A [bacterium]